MLSRIRSLGLAALVSALVATPALAGPPWISIELPANPYDQATRGAFLLVHAFHHGTPIGVRAQADVAHRRGVDARHQGESGAGRCGHGGHRARAGGRGGFGSCPDDAARRLDGAGAGLARGHRHGAQGSGRAARAALRTAFLLLMAA